MNCERALSISAKVGPALLLFVLIIYGVISLTSPKCFDNPDCLTCTERRTWSGDACRWCPLNNACHTMWSPKNPCMKRHNVRHPSLCSRPPRGRYNPYNAYKLALFSAIAYADDPEMCLTRVLPSDDFIVESIIAVDCDDYVFDYKKQCLAIIIVSHSRKEIAVAYRGTRGVKQIAEEILTMVAILKVASPVGGKVQHYFRNVHEKLYGEVKKKIISLLEEHTGYSVLVTGHSLGGAVASITSAALVHDKVLDSDDIYLYTYGMPRVGNKDYADFHNQLVRNSWRVVRHGDGIPDLPRCIIPLCTLFNGPYHHGQKVLYEGHFMNVNSQFLLCPGNDDSNSFCKQRVKRGVVGDFLNTHKEYFNIPIGTYCRDYVLKDLYSDS